MPNIENPTKNKNPLSKIYLLLCVGSWTISSWAQNFIECSGTMSAEKGVSASDIHWCQATQKLYQHDYVYTGYSKAGLGLIGEFLISKSFLIIGFIFFLTFVLSLIYQNNKNSKKTQPDEIPV